ncbi:MAG TPA: DUF72 domain-containing protein [Bacteroidales bacterium]|nr:DUF72 domain-containing protein [Bacteroidales bacterium]
MERFIGCSGYSYDHWKGIFYPDNLPKYKWLEFYVQHFKTVEINNTFYRMPDEKTVKAWHSRTPSDFSFAVKGFRFITHMKKLTVDTMSLDSLHQFQQTVTLLKDKLGPLLWQLPGSFTLNMGKLEKFCSSLSPELNHIFEFRHPTWFVQEVYDLLHTYHCGLCIISSPGTVPEVVKTTSNVAYIRFHSKGSWYDDNYSNEDLQAWKDKLDQIQADKLYAYFNNDIGGYAISNAKYMEGLLGKK